MPSRRADSIGWSLACGALAGVVPVLEEIHMAKIVVRGRGPFPIDMLRFAEAWPADSESVARIHNSIGREVIGEHASVGDVTLYGGRNFVTQHLLERWESFGWHAYVIEHGVVVQTTDPKQPLGEELRAAGERAEAGAAQRQATAAEVFGLKPYPERE
jgi:hypothetical protein